MRRVSGTCTSRTATLPSSSGRARARGTITRPCAAEFSASSAAAWCRSATFATRCGHSITPAGSSSNRTCSPVWGRRWPARGAIATTCGSWDSDPMLNAKRVYMLAADHRWQWEEWCDARSIPRARIGEVKRLAYDGFLLARERSAAVREYGALLIDEQYASAVLADALNAGVNVGTPAEKAGAFPLTWSTAPFSGALTGAFVK